MEIKKNELRLNIREILIEHIPTGNGEHTYTAICVQLLTFVGVPSGRHFIRLFSSHGIDYYFMCVCVFACMSALSL